MAKKSGKKGSFRAKKPKRAVPKGQSTAMLAWRGFVNNRLQQLEEQMLSILAGRFPQVKLSEIDPKAVFAEEE